MNLKKSVPILMSLGMIAGFSYFSSGITLLITFVPGVIVALVFYFFTFFKKQVDPQKILPLYLLALGIQFLHFAEEFIGGFNHKFPALFDAPEYSIKLFVLFNMSAYFLFIMGGIIIYMKKTHLMMIPLFFIVYGTIGNTIGHICFSIMNGAYFPGLYSSLLYWIVGPILIYRIWKETR